MSEGLPKAGVVLADPPWRYETAKPGQAIEDHYATMSLGDICRLPVQELCAKDCVLFLWTTAPKLVESAQVIEAWGFTYRTCAIWHKSGLGMGYYFRIDHELLLVCVRGSPGAPPPAARPRSVIRAPKRHHSRKPWEMYAIIERMYPEAIKLELFCRTPQPGWYSWGFEAHPTLFSGPILPIEILETSA